MIRHPENKDRGYHALRNENSAMKHTRSLGPFPAALLSVLLAGLSTGLVSTTATAQTPLLEVRQLTVQNPPLGPQNT